MGELALGSSRLDAEETADLLVGVSLHVVQHEHLAIPSRQALDGALQIDPILRTGWRAPGNRHLILFFVQGRVPPLAFAPELSRAVDGDPAEPGGQRRAPAERPEALDRANPRPLNQLLGPRLVPATEPKGEAIERRGVPAVEGAERRLVARADHRGGEIPVLFHGSAKSLTTIMMLETALPSSTTSAA